MVALSGADAPDHHGPGLEPTMQLYYDIAEELGVSNEHVLVTNVVGKVIWFSIHGTPYTCKMKGSKTERLVKNSIRRDFD